MSLFLITATVMAVAHSVSLLGKIKAVLTRCQPPRVCSPLWAKGLLCKKESKTHLNMHEFGISPICAGAKQIHLFFVYRS